MASPAQGGSAPLANPPFELPAVPQFKGRPGWEFTALPDGFSLENYEPAAGGDLTVDAERLLSVDGAAVELLQVDNAFEDGRAVEDGPVVLPLSVAVEAHPELVEPHLRSLVRGEDHFTMALESGWEGGAFVWIPRGIRVEAPIVLTQVLSAAGARVDRRVLIVVGEQAEAEVWEQWLSDDEVDGVLNVATEIVVEQAGRLKYVTAQNLGEKAYVFATQRTEVARDARLEWTALGFGSANGRIGMYSRLVGEGAEAQVTGAYAPRARQHIDYDTTQEHAAPNCISDLAFRGILADRATAVWKGNIIVDPGAQKTDAFQECRNLLLTKRAHADAIPGLEILANDVRCTHAAAVAQIDREQLFYLRTRGVSEETAKRLVVEGFLAELVERYDEGSVLREQVAGALEARLAQLLG